METEYFVGYVPRWFTLDTLYLVVGLPGELIGLRVGGQLFASPYQPQSSDPRAYFRHALASRYEGQNLGNPALVQLDTKNFTLASAEVASARIKRRRSFWTGGIPNSGSVVLKLRSGRSRKFILLGEQRLHVVASVLESASIPLATEVSG